MTGSEDFFGKLARLAGKEEVVHVTVPRRLRSGWVWARGEKPSSGEVFVILEFDPEDRFHPSPRNVRVLRFTASEWRDFTGGGGTDAVEGSG